MKPRLIDHNQPLSASSTAGAVLPGPAENLLVAEVGKDGDAHGTCMAAHGMAGPGQAGPGHMVAAVL